MCRELQSAAQCRPQVSTLGVMCSNKLAIHALVFASMFRARNATGKLELNSFVHTRQPRNLFVAKTTFKREVFFERCRYRMLQPQVYCNWLGGLYVSHGISSECRSRSSKLCVRCAVIAVVCLGMFGRPCFGSTAPCEVFWQSPCCTTIFRGFDKSIYTIPFLFLRRLRVISFLQYVTECL